MEDAGGTRNTIWVVTVNGTDDTRCTQAHTLTEGRSCGRNMEFHSFIVFVDGDNYTSTFTTVRPISLSLNGTGVQCAALRIDNVIGSSEICITGKIVMSQV